MEYELPVATHHSVGPTPRLYGHGPVTDIGGHVRVCLDCGYTAHDVRLFAHEECDRDENPVHTTWRERLEEYPAVDVLDMRSEELKDKHD